MSGSVRRWQGLLWWVAPMLALAALLGVRDWTGEEQIHRLPAAPALIEGKAIVPSVLPEYHLDPVASLNETVDRTLFNPTRRPAPAAPTSADGGPKAIQRGQFVLTGTTLAGTRSIAFLREVANGKARTVQGGDKINGMVVSEIGPDRVKFTLDGDVEELTLKVAAGPKVNVAAAPATGVPAVAGGRTVGGFGRRAGAAAAATAGEGAPPPNVAARRAASRAAAAAAAEQAPAGAAAAAPAANANSDPWANVYQKMQQGEQTQQPRQRGRTR